MSLIEDLDLPLLLTSFRDTLLHHVSASMSTATCAATGGTPSDDCRDDVAALRLKMAAVLSILLAGVTGVAVPLLGRKRGLHTDGSLFIFAKAFAGGVILATGFVHMLHDAQAALADPCLPESPWRRFPVCGFVAMMAALWTLVSEFVGTQFYEWKHRQEKKGSNQAGAAADPHTAVVMVEDEEEEEKNGHGHGHGHAHGDEDGVSKSNARHAVTSQVYMAH